ncbi:MAG: arsenate reductase (glutaredoxin) [Candidatus Melainabacteria bacterium]|nr:arsenate reductase (glutaredoxin) [Candidatus Melainabacteria bacterium]
MNKKITVYEKPTCTTCRKTNKLLAEYGVDFDRVNYYIEPLSASKLKELLKKMNIPARNLLRTKESLYKEMGLARKELSEKEIIDLMVEHPDLIERPIVERGDKAVLARPVENVRALLS